MEIWDTKKYRITYFFPLLVFFIYILATSCKPCTFYPHIYLKVYPYIWFHVFSQSKFCSSFTKNRIYSHIYMYTFHSKGIFSTHWLSILVIALVLLPLISLWCLHILNSKKPGNALNFSVQFQLIVIEGRQIRARWILRFDSKPVSFVILISSGTKFCSHEQVKKKKEKKPCLLHPEVDSFIEPGKVAREALTVEYEMASIRIWDG